MKVLIPNAKELNTTIESQPFQALSAHSQVILETLVEMAPDQLASFYHINPAKAQLEADRWQRIAQSQAKVYPAWQLYDGLMYRYMTRRDLSEAEQAYLRKHVFITTGLYGAINVFDLIAPHRLDFQGTLKIGEHGLKHYWRKQYDQLVQEDDLILSLLSSEFEGVFSPAIQKRMTKVTFMEDQSGQLKVHSTISKKGRGRLVSQMARNNVQTIDQLKRLSIDEFRYRVDLSSEKNLVFVRKGS